MLSDEWNPYHYVKEASSVNQPKEKDVEKVGIVSEKGTLIKSSVENATAITKDDAKTIQDEKEIQMKAPNARVEVNIIS